MGALRAGAENAGGSARHSQPRPDAFEHAEREPDPDRQRRCSLSSSSAVDQPVSKWRARSPKSRASRWRATSDISTRDEPTSSSSKGARPSSAPFRSRCARPPIKDLRRFGVTVYTNSIVTDVAAGSVAIGNESIRAETVIWAAGVSASPLGAALGVPIDRAGRVKVLPDLTIPGAPNVFVIGDLATLAGPDGRPLPGVAQVAIQMGQHAVRTFCARSSISRCARFATRTSATWRRLVAPRRSRTSARSRLTGLIAWLAWLFVHILNLIGFRNRGPLRAVAMDLSHLPAGDRLITGDDRG